MKFFIGRVRNILSVSQAIITVSIPCTGILLLNELKETVDNIGSIFKNGYVSTRISLLTLQMINLIKKKYN